MYKSIEPIFYPIFTKSTVKVEPVLGEFGTLKISWPSQAGATGYYIYGSPTPITQNKLNDTPITTTEYILKVPPSPVLLPVDVVFYFWVSWVDSNSIEHFISDEPAHVWVSEDPFETSPMTKSYEKYTFDNKYMRFIMEEIRRRHTSMLKNDAEPFQVFIRRRSGTPCKHDKPASTITTKETNITDTFTYISTQNEYVLSKEYVKIINKVEGEVAAAPFVFTQDIDYQVETVGPITKIIWLPGGQKPSSNTQFFVDYTISPFIYDADSDPNLNLGEDTRYSGADRCELCFGVGIVGGFYRPINLYIRYGNLPTRPYTYSAQGDILMHDFNSWTLWSPRLKDHDLLIRTKTGQRFEVSDIAESSWRGVITQQIMKLVELQPGDIRYKVSTDAISHAEEVAKLGNWDTNDYKIWA